MLKNFPTEVALAHWLGDEDFYIDSPKLVLEFMNFISNDNSKLEFNLIVNRTQEQYPELIELAKNVKSEIKCKYDKYWNLPQLIEKYGFPKELTFRKVK